VGITRVEGGGLRGAAATRVQELLRALAHEAPAAEAALAVGISAGLFDDIQAECGFDGDWRPMDAAGAWFRIFPVSEAAQAEGKGQG
jgi:hypothetical protein